MEDGQQSHGLLEERGRKHKPSSGKTEGRKRNILRLGSSHGKETEPMLQETLGNKCDVSIFKPNCPLAKVVKAWGDLVKTLPSKIIL
jgi:hypothetical protein